MAFTKKTKKISISHIEQEFTIVKPIAVLFRICIEEKSYYNQNDHLSHTYATKIYLNNSANIVIFREIKCFTMEF